MNVTFKQIEAFLAVADTLSFSQAAEQVHLSQPALSANIRRLEEELGARLFDRDTRTVLLTATGREFLTVASNLQNGLCDGLVRMRDFIAGHHGRLVVAASPSLSGSFVPHVFSAFAAQHPAVQLRLHDVLAEECAHMVRSGSADLAVAAEIDGSPDLLQRPLFRDYLVVMFPEEHPLVNRSVVAWDELRQFPQVVGKQGSMIRRILDAQYMERGMQLEPRFETHHVGTLAELVRAGLGIAVLPISILSSANTVGLAWRRFEARDEAFRLICAITLRQRTPTPASSHFLRLCAEKAEAAEKHLTTP